MRRSAEIVGIGSKDDFAAVEPQSERLHLFKHHHIKSGEGLVTLPVTLPQLLSRP